MKQLIFNAHDMVLLATIYLVVLFTMLVFFVKSERHKSDFFLIGFLITQALIPLNTLVNYGDAFRLVALEISPDLFRVFEFAFWLEGPLLLWYTRALIYKNLKIRWRDFMYLAPVLVYLTYMYITFFSLDHQTKYNMLLDWRINAEPLLRHVEGFIRELLRVVFGLACLIELGRSRKQIRDRYSYADSIEFGWLNLLIVGFLTIRTWALFVSSAIILDVYAGLNVDFETMGLAGNYVTLLLVTALIFFSLARTSLFEGIDEDKEVPSHLDKESFDEGLINKIELHMQEQKPYLANILTLDHLANQLELSPRLLSTIINRHYHRNFFEFINHYRVQEAQKLLADPALKDKTIMEIMGICGFNSKASYNTFFKKIVGLTPTQYRRKSQP